MTVERAAVPSVPRRPLLIVPGLGGSGSGHWQTLWQHDLADARRVEQSDWDVPRRAEWLAMLSTEVHSAPGAVIIAHSLGCILLAHLIARNPTAPVAGALLVAPADVEASPAREAVQDFAPIPMQRLPFPSVVVASSNDPFVSIARATAFAHAWAASLIDIGPHGHINVEAGFGAWPEGRLLLGRLLAAP
jgi:predicted alpha/beta hydrolase family esterase